MVRPGRFELPTFCSGGKRSIQLSYGRALVGLFIVVSLLPAGQTPACAGNTPNIARRYHGSDMAQSSLLFIGVQGTVLAIDRATGQEVWRSHLKGSDFVNVVLEDGDLYAATHGELYCLDVATGRTRWHNPLKGLGWGLITIAGNQQTVVLRAKKQADESAAAVAAT